MFKSKISIDCSVHPLLPALYPGLAPEYTCKVTFRKADSYIKTTGVLIGKCEKDSLRVVSFAAVFTFVTQRSSPPLWGGALRDKPKNGCEGDYPESYTYQDPVTLSRHIFYLYTTKGFAEGPALDLLRINTVSELKLLFLSPKRYDENPCPFYTGAPPGNISNHSKLQRSLQLP